MAIAVQRYVADNGDAQDCLYVFGGSNWFKDRSGKPDLAGFECFADAYRYNPRTPTLASYRRHAGGARPTEG